MGVPSSIALTGVSLACMGVFFSEMKKEVRSKRMKRSDLKKRMKSLRMQGLMDGMLRDFERSVPMVDDQMRFGKKYLFLAHAGNALAYDDIRMIRFSSVPKNASCIRVSFFPKETRYFPLDAEGAEEKCPEIKVSFHGNPGRTQKALRGALDELKERQPDLSAEGNDLINTGKR